MFKMSSRCSKHQKPLRYIAYTQDLKTQLFCQVCQTQYGHQNNIQRKIIQIDTYIDLVKQKTKRETHRKKYQLATDQLTSTGSNTLNSSVLNYNKCKYPLIKQISKDQANILQILMKILSEDKKYFHSEIDRSLKQHRKLWEQYYMIDKDVMFLNKLAKNRYLDILLTGQSIKGWQRLKQVLKSMNQRKYICKKIIEQSEEIQSDLNKFSALNQKGILNELNKLIQGNRLHEQKKQQSQLNRKYDRESRKNKHKRSQSYQDK